MLKGSERKGERERERERERKREKRNCMQIEQIYIYKRVGQRNE